MMEHETLDANHQHVLETAMAEFKSGDGVAGLASLVGMPPVSVLTRQIIILARLDGALLSLKNQLAAMSMTEGLLAVVALLFWMANRVQQRGVWLHFPHFGRWILGLMLCSKIPLLDEFIPEESDSCASSSEMPELIATQAHGWLR
jgi:hypothetical protein